MNRLRSIRSLVVASAVALMAVGMVVSATPAAAGVAPTVNGPAPMSGPLGGGIPVRIYGSDFTGATAVKFDTTNATSYAVIDDNLITAVVPAYGGSSNTAVDIKVTTSFGTGTLTGGFYYTGASFTVTPTTGLHPSDTVTAALTSYAATKSIIFPEFNPLQVYLEGVGACSKGGSATCPPAFTGSPAYAQVLGSQQTTDGSGNYTYNSLALPASFSGNNGTSYDANIACPVNQTTADYLGDSAPVSLNKPGFSGRCYLGVNQFGVGTLERRITYTTDPTPAAPTLAISPTSGHKGTTINITPASSTHWNANPLFGSSTTAGNPGQTIVQVKVCGLGGVPSSCSTTVSTDATVDMTRYKTSSTTTPITAVFSGATAAGSVVVGTDVSPCTCTVRVRQWLPGFAPPSTSYIEKTATLTIT